MKGKGKRILVADPEYALLILQDVLQNTVYPTIQPMLLILCLEKNSIEKVKMNVGILETVFAQKQSKLSEPYFDRFHAVPKSGQNWVNLTLIGIRHFPKTIKIERTLL